MNPKVTIVTSVYNGDEFLQPFLEDMTQMLRYHECQHIFVNANSTGNEEHIIKEFIQSHPNAHYISMSYDPGLYRIWNMSIQIADAEYITNANLDDRRSKYFLRDSIECLDQNPKIDIVSAPVFVSKVPNETFDRNTAYDIWYAKFRGEYEKKDLFMYNRLGTKIGSMNVPHSNPIWRKRVHQKVGFFDQSFNPFSDWEFWLRCASNSIRFYNLSRPLSLYYHNPEGLSTDEREKQKYKKLINRLLRLYG